MKEWYWGGKEQLRSFYDLNDKQEAGRHLTEIIRFFEEHDDAAMNDWGRTIRRWKEYILNYFDHKTTNSDTEGAQTNKNKITHLLALGQGLED